MKVPALVVKVSKALGVTACPQPTYSSEARLRLWCLRDADGHVTVARIIAGWRDETVFELSQLEEVAHRFGREPVVVRVQGDDVMALTPAEALAAIEADCLERLGKLAGVERGLRWRLQEARNAQTAQCEQGERADPEVAAQHTEGMGAEHG